MAAMAAEARCQQCGSTVAQSSDFCPVCGARIARIEADESPDQGTGVVVAAGAPAFETVTVATAHISDEQPVAAWRWALLAMDAVLLCVCLVLTAWNWWDPPRQNLPPAVPAIFATPTATAGSGPVFTVPATTPRPTAMPTPTRTKSSGGHGGSPRATATPTKIPAAPTATPVPTATSTPGPTPTPTATPIPTATPGSEG